MSDREDQDVVLARLPGGARVTSTLLTDRVEARHVYRVVGADGTVLLECATLVELNTFVGQLVDQAEALPADPAGEAAAASRRGGSASLPA